MAAIICITVTACPLITVIYYISVHCAIKYCSTHDFLSHTLPISAFFFFCLRLRPSPPPHYSPWISFLCFFHPSWGKMISFIFWIPALTAPPCNKEHAAYIFYNSLLLFHSVQLSLHNVRADYNQMHLLSCSRCRGHPARNNLQQARMHSSQGDTHV